MDKERNPAHHIVAVTAHIVRDGKVLILKRALREKAFPGRWAVVGGKIERGDYEMLPRDADFPQWHGVVEHILRKEVREEAGLEISTPRLLSRLGDLVFERGADGERVLVLVHWALWASGEVRLNYEHDDHAWVTLEEAAGYNLIDGTLKEMKQVFEEIQNPR